MSFMIDEGLEKMERFILCRKEEVNLGCDKYRNHVLYLNDGS